MSFDCSLSLLHMFVLPLLGVEQPQVTATHEWHAGGHWHLEWRHCCLLGHRRLGLIKFWIWSYMCGLTAGDYKVLYGIGTEKKHTDCLLSGHLCLFILGTFSTYSVSHLSHMQHGTDSGYRYIYILPWSHLLLLFTLSAKPPPWPHTFHLLAPGVPGTECYQQCAWWHTHGINNMAFSLCINPISFAFSSQMPPPLFFLDLHHLVLHSTCTAQDNWKTSLQETSSGLKWLNLPPAQSTPTT